jgi:hypothetical protein
MRKTLLALAALLMFAAVGAAPPAGAAIYLNYGSIPSNSCIGTGGTANACDSVPASASIGANSCKGNGGFSSGYGACGGDGSLQSVGANSCDGIADPSIGYAACGGDGSLQSVGANSCDGIGFNGACAREFFLQSVGANSCDGSGIGFQFGSCTLNRLQSVGANSCNGSATSGACISGNLTSVGNNSCNGPSACSNTGSLTSVGDCQDNTVVVAACVPPTIEVPPTVVVDATSPAGAIVNYASLVSFGDPGGSGLASSGCSPTSGSLFPIGPTTVNCSATTNAGTSATASFTVDVKGAAEQLADLQTQVVGVGPGKSLANKLTLVQGDLDSNDTADACGTLGGFINEVNAQSASIGTTLAASLTTQAQAIQTALGC